MNLRTSLRASSVKWAAPFALGLSLFYYFANGSAPSNALSYAPTLTSSAMSTIYGVTYAIAAGLAAWESGRLRLCGVWDLAPARSRYRIAANALAPVLGLVLLIPALPVALALGSAGVLPTPGSLRLLAMTWLLCVCHAVLGFAVGLRMPRVFAAPVVTVVVWVLVSFSWSTDPFWIRHVSGQYPTYLMFGELAGLDSLVPHILFTGGIAAGVLLLWLPLRPVVLRAALACAVAVAGPSLAHRITQDWGASPPLLTGQAPMVCSGSDPKVCMPEAAAGSLPDVRGDALSVLDDLRSAGVALSPAVITDRLSDGRFGKPTTEKTWRIGLTNAARNGSVRYQVLQAAVRFPCERVDARTGDAVLWWAATVTGEEKAYRERMNRDRAPSAAEDDTRDTVREVRTRSAAEQGRWFRDSLTDACRRAT